MCPRLTGRKSLLVSGLLVAIGTGVLVAAAFGAVAGGQHAVKEGGTLTVGVRNLDFIDPALTLPFNGGTSVGLVSRGLEDATCALLFRYPVAPPPIVRYDLVPEVATGYPAVSPDGRTYTFTIRKGYRFSTGK